jgi:hypothetical protein
MGMDASQLFDQRRGVMLHVGMSDPVAQPVAQVVVTDTGLEQERRDESGGIPGWNGPGIALVLGTTEFSVPVDQVVPSDVIDPTRDRLVAVAGRHEPVRRTFRCQRKSAQQRTATLLITESRVALDRGDHPRTQLVEALVRQDALCPVATDSE